MKVSDIKAVVKARDGGQCVACKMTDANHRLVYGRGLHVHRKEPGAEYTIDGSETVCATCHSERHIELRGD